MREAALVGGAIFHPAVGLEFFEELSTLNLQNKEIRELHSLLLDIYAGWQGEEPFPPRDEVAERMVSFGKEASMDALAKQLAEANLWQLLPPAAFEDARDGWHQAYVLHLKNQTLHTELKAAERALADENSQENLDRMLLIQQELSRSDGLEALIDGFGVSSGRPARGF